MKEQLQKMEDMDLALSSAIAHSGAGAQRERWVSLQTELRDAIESFRRTIARAEVAGR